MPLPNVSSPSLFAPSPYVVIPPCTRPFKPVYWVSRMKLTTPATASVPYAADAPPVTTSVRFSSDWGMTLTSIVPLYVEGTMRRPSSRISVRFPPRLRILRIDWPASVPMPLFCVASTLPRNCGSCLNASTTFPGATRSSCSEVTTVTGVGVFIPVSRSREPVTVTSSTGEAGAGAVAPELASCAAVGPATPRAVSPARNDVTKPLRCCAFIRSPPVYCVGTRHALQVRPDRASVADCARRLRLRQAFGVVRLAGPRCWTPRGPIGILARSIQRSVEPFAAARGIQGASHGLSFIPRSRLARVRSCGDCLGDDGGAGGPEAPGAGLRPPLPARVPPDLYGRAARQRHLAHQGRSQAARDIQRVRRAAGQG